jgi:DNA-binding response OmpR family regulator
MKRVIIVSDDTHTQAWASSAVSGLDLQVLASGTTEVIKRLSDEHVDLAIVEGGRDPEVLSQSVEHAAAGGAEVALLVLVEPEGLPALRLPVRLNADFMVRGGSSEELSARVRALLWPGEEATRQELIRIDDLTLNLATYQANLAGHPVDFTYLEYSLFAFLVTHPGRTYSREVLLRRVWGTDYYGGSRTVDVHVRRIRAKLGPELGRRLETVRNVGYLWNA